VVFVAQFVTQAKGGESKSDAAVSAITYAVANISPPRLSLSYQFPLCLEIVLTLLTTSLLQSAHQSTHHELLQARQGQERRRLRRGLRQHPRHVE